MKKLLVIVIIVVSSVGISFAQGTKVASAYQYLRDEQPEKAKPEIDAATTYEGTMNEAKTWFYRGNTYLQLYLGAHMTDFLKKGMSSEELKAVLGNPFSVRRFKKLDNGEKYSYMYEMIVYMSNDSVDHWDYPMEKTFKDLDDGKLLEVAYESYAKALELDGDFQKPELSPGTPAQGIMRVGMSYSNIAYTALRKEDFKTSLINFEKVIPIYRGAGKNEELKNIYYYAGYSAEYTQDTAKAIKYYQSAVNKGIDNTNTYIHLASLYLKVEEVEKALAVTKKGREVKPDDLGLLITEANIYMHDNRPNEAIKILTAATEKDPNNSQLQYAIGVNYDKMRKDSTLNDEVKQSMFDKSVIAYKRAIEIDNKYFNAYFNLGALFYNKAADKLTVAGNLPYSEAKKYDRLKSEAKELFTNAIPNLEEAHKLQPKDHNTMVMLRTAYTQTGDVEGFKRMKAELSGK